MGSIPKRGSAPSCHSPHAAARRMTFRRDRQRSLAVQPRAERSFTNLYRSEKPRKFAPSIRGLTNDAKSTVQPGERDRQQRARFSLHCVAMSHAARAPDGFLPAPRKAVRRNVDTGAPAGKSIAYVRSNPQENVMADPVKSSDQPEAT